MQPSDMLDRSLVKSPSYLSESELVVSSMRDTVDKFSILLSQQPDSDESISCAKQLDLQIQAYLMARNQISSLCSTPFSSNSITPPIEEPMIVTAGNVVEFLTQEVCYKLRDLTNETRKSRLLLSNLAKKSVPKEEVIQEHADFINRFIERNKLINLKSKEASPYILENIPARFSLKPTIEKWSKEFQLEIGQYMLVYANKGKKIYKFCYRTAPDWYASTFLNIDIKTLPFPEVESIDL